jgi:hypothetical protein
MKRCSGAVVTALWEVGREVGYLSVTKAQL